MQKYLSSISQLIFPNLCVCCTGYLSHQEEFICDLCLHTLSRFETFEQKDNKIAQLFWGRVNLEYATALLQFTPSGDVRNILHEIKYKNAISLGLFMGAWMGNKIQNSTLFKGIDCIIPLPLHPKKELFRGYNQAGLLSDGLGSIINVPVVSDAIIRTRHTSTQTKKQRYDRYVNTNKIFEISRMEKIRGKHVLLIDDVITTGATIESAALELLSVEGVKVSVLALASA